MDFLSWGDVQNDYVPLLIRFVNDCPCFRRRCSMYFRRLFKCVFRTSILFERHSIWRGWCFFSFCCSWTAVLRPINSEPLDRESRPNCMASMFARFDSTWLLFMRIYERLCVPWTPCSHTITENQNWAGHPNRWRKYIEESLQKYGDSDLLRIERGR